jgi:prevent-host-death family protein
MSGFAKRTRKKSLAELLDRASSNGERIVVRRQNRPVAAVVPIEDLELLEAIEDKMDIEQVRARLKEPTIPWSKLKEQLGL